MKIKIFVERTQFSPTLFFILISYGQRCDLPFSQTRLRVLLSNKIPQAFDLLLRIGKSTQFTYFLQGQNKKINCLIFEEYMNSLLKQANKRLGVLKSPHYFTLLQYLATCIGGTIFSCIGYRQSELQYRSHLQDKFIFRLLDRMNPKEFRLKLTHS